MRIGILSAELGEEDAHENRRLMRETMRLGHKAVIINYRKTVVVTAGRRDEIRANLSLGSIGLSYEPSEWEIELAERAAPAYKKNLEKQPIRLSDPVPVAIKKARPKISKALSPEAIKLIRIKVKTISE